MKINTNIANINTTNCSNGNIYSSNYIGGELLTCPYPLKVQACPPQDQRPALLFTKLRFLTFTMQVMFTIVLLVMTDNVN